jgi:hypothetical protein
MSPPITVSDINARLAKRNIKMLGEHSITKNKAEFVCNQHHKWYATINSVLAGNGCPKCALTERKLKWRANLNSLLELRGVEMVGEYFGDKTYTKFKCVRCLKSWSGRPIIVKHSGCCFCNGTKIDKDIINQRIIDTGIKLLTEVHNVGMRGSFECPEGHPWDSIVSNVLHNKSGCPKCAKYGFNPTLPAVCYVICYSGYIKFGITNNWSRRRSEHIKTKGKFIREFIKSVPSGDKALLWENYIKATLPCGIVNSSVCNDGWTETINTELLPNVIDSSFTEIYDDSAPRKF